MVTDGVNRFPLPDDFVLNGNEGRRSRPRSPAAYMDREVFVNPYNPVVINTGGKLVVIDTGTGRGGLPGEQGPDRPVPHQPRGRRHRRQARSIP